jgi:hypothetical protein
MHRWRPLVCALHGTLWADDALAYRPFDGTDAAVAEPGLFEIELGPARYQQIGPDVALFARDLVFNYGLAEHWELVMQGSLTRRLEVGASGVALTGNGVFLKGMLREGGLQEKPGPSIATEFGFLLQADIAFSAIVEGPDGWTVRPVAKLLYEHDYGGTETTSALIGAIWRVRENISFDVGFRGGWVNDQPLREVRAGVTFAFRPLDQRP